MNFLDNFKTLKVFMVVDDDAFIVDSKKYPNINFIQIDSEVCSDAGYKHLGGLLIKKDITAWDKALYYFTKVKKCAHVWFIEDDVYFKSEKTLLAINKKYSDDLLLANISVNKEGGGGSWHWGSFIIEHPPPYYASIVCATRISKKLLKAIEVYAEKNRTLYFLEAFFPTECIVNKLSHRIIPELNGITCCDAVNLEALRADKLYHPMKDISIYEGLRNKKTRKIRHTKKGNSLVIKMDY
jgi:hypothetical protein